MLKTFFFLLALTVGLNAFAFTNDELEILDNVFENQNEAVLCLTPEKEEEVKVQSTCTPEAFKKMKEHFPAAALNQAMEMQSQRHGTICKYCRPQFNPEVDPKTGYYVLDTNTVLNACNRMMIQGGLEGVGDMAKLIWKVGVGSVEMVVNGETIGDKVADALLKSLSNRSSGELAQFLVEQCPKIKPDPTLICQSHSFKYNTTIQNFRKELAGTAAIKEKIHPKLKEALIMELVKSEAKNVSSMVIDQVEGFGCLPLNQRTLMACDVTGYIVLSEFMAGLGFKAASKLISQVPKLGKFATKGSKAAKVTSAMPDQAPTTVGFKQHSLVVTPSGTTPSPKKMGFHQQASQASDNILDQFKKNEPKPLGFHQEASKTSDNILDQFKKDDPKPLGFHQKAQAVTPDQAPASKQNPIGFKQQAPSPYLKQIKARLSPAAKILPDDQIEGILHELRRINCL